MPDASTDACEQAVPDTHSPSAAKQTVAVSLIPPFVEKISASRRKRRIETRYGLTPDRDQIYEIDIESLIEHLWLVGAHII